MSNLLGLQLPDRSEGVLGARASEDVDLEVAFQDGG